MNTEFTNGLTNLEVLRKDKRKLRSLNYLWPSSSMDNNQNSAVRAAVCDIEFNLLLSVSGTIFNYNSTYNCFLVLVLCFGNLGKIIFNDL